MPPVSRPHLPEHKNWKITAIILMSVSLLMSLIVTTAISAFGAIRTPSTANAQTSIPAEVTASTAVQPIRSTVSENLESAWKNIIDNRQGSIDIAVYNNKTGETTHYSNTANTFNTASIVKLSIAEAVLLKAQSQGIALTSQQTANIAPMIENSDNTAASILWSELGGKEAMDQFFASIGATSTAAGSDGMWGLTQTTAMDQLAALNAFAYPGKVLSASSSATLASFLDNVETDQTWGVSYGLALTDNFDLKDGWLEDAETDNGYADTDSWTVNSIGHVWNDDIDYTIAVLTSGQATEEYGVQTIERLSAATRDLL